MVNMFRIFGVLFFAIILIAGAMYGYQWYNSRYHYTPINDYVNNGNVYDKPTMQNFQERLNEQYKKYDAIAANPTNTPIPTVIIEPTIITPTATIIPTLKPTPTLKPIPQERVTGIKAGDSDKIKLTNDGIDAIKLAINPSSLYLGRQYYYVGDYAVFNMEFINVGDKVITNPKVVISAYAGSVPVFSTNTILDIDLKPTEKSDMKYFELTIPNFRGFYRIVFEIYDSSTNERLMSFYKEINIL